MRSTTQKYKLERFLHAIKIGALEEFSQDEINYELLRLILSFSRSIHRINLRTQRQEAFTLAMVTVGELCARKGKDPTLNKAFKNLKNKDGLTDSEFEDLLLEMASRILDGTAARNKVISTLPRIRTEHPLKTIMREVVEDFPQSNHQIHRKKAILVAKNKNMIDKDDDEIKRVIFLDENIKTITYGTIEQWAKDLKK